MEKLLAKSQKDNLSIENLKDDIKELNDEIIKNKDESIKYISQIEDSYRITTSKGLAGAFTEKAQSLSLSVLIWVGGLLIALITGAIIGADRLETLTKLLASDNASSTVVVGQIFLSIISLGLPLWFAWLSTKQIGQRFRLAEDYAFKASVSKAYEGYRKEAARIDEKFEAKLFDTVLNRLDEPPLRHIEDTQHGSPWHEIASTVGLEKLTSVLPDLKDTILKQTK